MRNFYLFLLLLCCGLAFGQSRVVAKKIESLNAKSQPFTGYDLFSKNNDTQKASRYLTSATDVTVLNINQQELQRVVEEAPEFISIAVPYQDEMIEVQMYKQNILTDEFKVKDESGNYYDYTPGQYYRGVVAGDYTSLAAISFFEDNVMGVVSTNEIGNLVLGKSTDKVDYITYSDRNILGENPYECGFDELEYNQQMEGQISFDPEMMNSPNTTNCVKIYYEVAYRPYLNNGSNVTTTVNWLTGIQNNIATLYNNDDIDVALNMIKVWTYDDPYDGSYGENLEEFAMTVHDFEGDIAHLVNTPTTTSVAYLNSLCTNYNYAYSGISLAYSQVPTYSWTIMAMTHEMGHSFGSPHTHSCSWNGNNTAIDGCYPTEGSCPNPGIPSGGGTIMSYCHLQNVGINFNLGFGPQPAALIRSTIDSKTCLQTNCIDTGDSCTISIEELTVVPNTNGSFSVSFVDNTSESWKYRVYPFGTTPPDSWTPINSTSFTVDGLEDHQYYEVEVINVCDVVLVGRGRTGLMLPGDFCDGTLFTDTGGTTASYSSNQHLIKTFYPSSPDEKVNLNFIKIGVQTNVDFMYVYNGDSTDAPLFAGGTITGNNNPGPSFTSTDESGAITIKFISSPEINNYGWEAVVNCSALGIEEMSDSFGVLVYPNPTSDVLNISSQKAKIDSVSIVDAAGRTVLSNKLSNNSGSIKIGHLPKGVYILTLKLDGQTVTKKIIKK